MRLRRALLVTLAAGGTAIACAAVTGLDDYVLADPDAAVSGDVMLSDGPVVHADTGPTDPLCEKTGSICDVILAPDVLDIATSASALYWIDSASRIRTANLDGSNARDFLLGEAPPLQAIEFHDDFVFWVANAKVRRIPASGDGGIETIASITPGCLHFGAAHLLVPAPAGGFILSIAIDGGGPANLVNGQPNVWGIDAVQLDAGFFTTGEDDGGTVKIETNSGANIATLYSGQAAPRCLVVDDERQIFWANRGSGEIMEGTFDGAPAVVLARDQPSASGIGLVPPYLYWSYAGGIRRLRL